MWIYIWLKESEMKLHACVSKKIGVVGEQEA